MRRVASRLEVLDVDDSDNNESEDALLEMKLESSSLAFMSDVGDVTMIVMVSLEGVSGMHFRAFFADCEALTFQSLRASV